MKPRASLLTALVLLAFLGLLSSRIRLTDSLAALLPQDGPLNSAMAHLERFEVTNMVLVEVDGTGATRAELLAATDALGQTLQAEADFASVRWRLDASDGAALLRAVSPHAVDLVPAEQLARRTSPAGIHDALAAGLARLAGPGGSLFERQFVADPLDVRGLALASIREAGGPFRIRTEDGHFLDEAGQHAVLLAEPTRTMLEAGPESTLPATMERLLGQASLPARWMGGPRIATESARSMAADARRASAVGSVLMIALFAVGFRSVRPLFGALGPLAIAGAATAAMCGLISPIHGISLGFMAALLGLSVDYWVHLYVAAAARAPRGGFADRLQAANEAWKELSVALAIGAASTVGAFAVLLFSDFPLIASLGYMGIAAASGALLGTRLLGPLAFALVGYAPLERLRAPAAPTWLRAVIVLSILVFAGLATSSEFDGDPRDLLPKNPETEALQDELNLRYGGFGTGGMAVVEDAELGRALDAVERIELSLDRLPGVQASGPSALLPGPQARAARRAALPTTEDLQARIDEQALALGFVPGALAGAAKALQPGEAMEPEAWEGTPVASLVHRHVRQTKTGWSAMAALVVDDPSVIDTVESTVLAAAPTAELVLPSKLAEQGVDQVVDELVRLGGLSLALVLVLLGVRYRDPQRAFAALLPCLAALAVAGGTLALAHIPWNALSAGGLVLILGLGLDYGVFMTEAGDRGEGPTSRSVLLSALSTIAGFGALVTAQAPALSGIGLVLLVGISAAAVTALALVPAMRRSESLVGPTTTRLLGRAAWLAALLLTLDALGSQLVFLRPPDGTPPAGRLEEPTAGDRRFGKSRLLLGQGLHTALLVGSPYERGYAMWRLAPDLDLRLERQLLDTFARAVPSALARLAIVRGTALVAHGLDQTFTPEQRLEIAGFARATPGPFDRLGPNYTRRVYYHAIHDIGQSLVDSPVVVTACTGFMARDSRGHWLLARNFDFDGGTLFDLDKLVTFVAPDRGIPFVQIGFTGFSGVVSGLNAEGLAIALQAGASAPPIRVGRPMTLIAREILQYASSLDEAETLLERYRAFVSENVLVVDGDADEAALFEVSPDRVERIPVQDAMGVSNHFRSPAFEQDEVNRQRMAEGTTVPRLERMEGLLDEHAGRLDMAAAAEILMDRGDLPPGHRDALNADIATHGAILDATSRTLWVSRYPNLSGGWVQLDLAAALAGDIEPVEVLAASEVERTLQIHHGRMLLLQAREARPLEGVRLARRALELMPDHPAALQVLAEALVRAGQADEAVPLIEQALATPPEYPHQARELRELLATVSP